MDQEMTVDQIEQQFDSEWVVLENPRTDEATVYGGTVRYHGKDRDEAYRRAGEILPKRFAILYTGKIPPPGEAILL
jgi:hypothetical protein